MNTIEQLKFAIQNAKNASIAFAKLKLQVVGDIPFPEGIDLNPAKTESIHNLTTELLHLVCALKSEISQTHKLLVNKN